MTLADWIDALCTELDVPRDVVDERAILDLARETAHGIERPAAPVSAFILGYAAASTAPTQGDRALLYAAASRLVEQHVEK